MSLDRRVRSSELHETENTRAIAAGFAEKNITVYGPVLHGFHLVEDLVGSEHGRFGGPVFTLCHLSIQQQRWVAVPLNERWLTRLGVSEDAVRSNATSFAAARSQAHPYVLERVSGGIEVVSPHFELVLMAYGFGHHRWLAANARGNPDYGKALDDFLGPGWQNP